MYMEIITHLLLYHLLPVYLLQKSMLLDYQPLLQVLLTHFYQNY